MNTLDITKQKETGQALYEFICNTVNSKDTFLFGTIPDTLKMTATQYTSLLNQGALKEMLAPFKFKIGVYQGNGKQWFSWIHINDIVQLYIFALQNNKIRGAVNGSSPYPVSNRKFIETTAGLKNVKLILPVPEFILKIVVGEFAKNLCTGQRVEPEVALKEEFGFNFPELKPALENILKS